jgi:hypothetical protein
LASNAWCQGLQPPKAGAAGPPLQGLSPSHTRPLRSTASDLEAAFSAIYARIHAAANIKERAIERCRADGSADLTRIWNIIIHMFATNVGADLYRERRRRKLVLINNSTNIPFVAGDQPAINLKGTRSEAPERLSIYYQISPTLALILGDVDEEHPMSPRC